MPFWLKKFLRNFVFQWNVFVTCFSSGGTNWCILTQLWVCEKVSRLDWLMNLRIPTGPKTSSGIRFCTWYNTIGTIPPTFFWILVEYSENWVKCLRDRNAYVWWKRSLILLVSMPFEVAMLSLHRHQKAYTFHLILID